MLIKCISNMHRNYSRNAKYDKHVQTCYKRCSWNMPTNNNGQQRRRKLSGDLRERNHDDDSEAAMSHGAHHHILTQPLIVGILHRKYKTSQLF